ncbi:MAG: RNase H-like domain-containing protein [Sedimenticola sp.]
MNKEFEIFEFRQFKQTESETVDQFATRLRQKANNCEFGNTDGEIKSQIIQGCTSTPLRRKALKDSMDLSALLLSARTMEIANRQADKIGSDLGHEKIHVVRRKSTKPAFPRQPERQQPRFFGAKPPRPASTPTSVCRSCGGLYPHQHGCPAYGKTCNYCKKPNHFVSQCLRRKRRNRKITQIGNTEIGNTESENEAESGQEEDYSFGVNANNVNTKRSAPKTTVKINDYETKVLVDTGSSLNILDESVYMKMQDKPKLSKPDTKAFAYGQKQQLPIKGKFQAKIETDTKITTGNFYVISGNYGSLLSYSTAVDLNIVPAINSVDTPKTDQLVGEYSDLFHGLGKLKDKVIKLHIDESVAPVALPHRRIPFHIRKQVEKELDRLESTDIIEKVVEGATPWCSPIVVAPKPKSPDEIRICVDMRKANQAIGRERHITPTIDDLITELNGAKVFSTIDLKNGFHQIVLAPESRSITTFSTHVGLYRYKRLNMGVTSAPEIFQNEVRQVLEGLHGVRNISDDIIVYGKNQAEHDRNLEAVFGRLRENNLTLNKQKCKFSQPKLVFFGYVFSESGLSADPSKVDAIKHADTPSTPSEVRSYLGMTNYVSRFIPNYSTITEPLRRLTRESEPWVWTDSQQNAFETLKKTLSSDTVIAYFDPSKETELWTDASPVGLSAIMTQENRIIGYASKALSPVEQRYSQVERECLGIVWGIEHFHLYLFGHTFNLITDHCPLVAIFNTPKAKQPLRLERWRLRLATYDFKVVYRAGKNNIADYMSRHPHASASDTEMSVADDYVSYIAHNAVPKSMTITDISRETQNDETMLKVIRSVKSNRWDKSECQSNKTYNSYARLSDELTVVEIEGKNVLLRGTKLAIPSSLQQKVIDLAHEGHQGIVRTKALLREKVWFPCIDDLVDKTCKSCIPCIAVTPTSTSEPVKMSELPSRPWDEVSIDFFGPIPSGDYIMVILDDYTRFPVLEILTSTSSKAVIPRLDNVFSTMGVPSIVKTDNGPPFNGHEFSQFAEYLGFRHRKITPLHPIANGHAERFMQPLAKCIKTAKIEGKNYKQELNKFLRNYRSTPHQTTKISPAEALFSRKMKTTLPQFDTPLNDESIRRKDGEMKQKAKMYTDIKRSANESQLSHGDYVLVKQQKKNKLSSYYNPEPGTVLEKKGSMVSVRVGDRTVTRDASHFRRLPLSTRGGINYGGPSDPGPPDNRQPGGNRRSVRLQNK